MQYYDELQVANEQNKKQHGIGCLIHHSRLRSKLILEVVQFEKRPK
jgi:hypothetical protein